MSLSFCVLGSGSAGNCTLVVLEDELRPGVRRCFLIDAGLSPRATAKRLEPFGFDCAGIAAIVLTHLDHDHFHCGWLKQIARRGDIAVHLHRRHRSVAWQSGLNARFASLFDETLDLGAGSGLRAILLAHDDLGSVGMVIEHAGLRLGYATDLGRVTPSLLRHFRDIDALAIESNYDRRMQMESSRPAFLKRRIMGGAGHLSNDEALNAVRQIDAQAGLSHIALLHLSRQCNEEKLVRELYRREAPHLLARLTITHQRWPSPLLRVAPGQPRAIHPAQRIDRLIRPRRSSQLFLFDGIGLFDSIGRTPLTQPVAV